MGGQIDVSLGGVFTLVSPGGVETVVDVNPMLVEEAVGADESVQLALTPTHAYCYNVSVQNIKLVSTLDSLMYGDGGGDAGTYAAGTNLIHVSMGQALNGAANAPTVYTETVIPFVYIAPNSKSPSGPYVTLQQDDLTMEINN